MTYLSGVIRVTVLTCPKLEDQTEQKVLEKRGKVMNVSSMKANEYGKRPDQSRFCQCRKLPNSLPLGRYAIYT